VGKSGRKLIVRGEWVTAGNWFSRPKFTGALHLYLICMSIESVENDPASRRGWIILLCDQCESHLSFCALQSQSSGNDYGHSEVRATNHLTAGHNDAPSPRLCFPTQNAWQIQVPSRVRVMALRPLAAACHPFEYKLFYVCAIVIITQTQSFSPPSSFNAFFFAVVCVIFWFHELLIVESW